jgi:inosose dehydratase
MDVVSNGISIGTASVNWGFDPLYTWVRTPSFERMLDEMAQAGYEGTEISYNFPEDATSLAAQLQKRHLRPAATFHAVNLRRRENHAAALKGTMRIAARLHALGSRVLILSDEVSPQRIAIAGRVRRADELDVDSWQAMADGLRMISEALAATGMQAVFHPHVGTYVETAHEIERLCELTENSSMGLCPDTGHLAYAGADAAEIFLRYRDRIGYVHLKDVDPKTLDRVRADRIDFTTAVRLGLFVELGRGAVPIARILGCLRDAGYAGWIIIEQDAPSNPFASAKANRDYLREQFAL